MRDCPEWGKKVGRFTGKISGQGSLNREGKTGERQRGWGRQRGNLTCPSVLGGEKGTPPQRGPTCLLIRGAERKKRNSAACLGWARQENRKFFSEKSKKDQQKLEEEKAKGKIQIFPVRKKDSKK